MAEETEIANGVTEAALKTPLIVRAKYTFKGKNNDEVLKLLII